MISAKDIHDLQVAAPFRPFKLHLSDGRTVSIDHPEQLLVYRNSVVVAQRDKDGELPERGERFSILHITSLEGVETH
jgi:hypothetical protein